jgi:hypothetical protein
LSEEVEPLDASVDHARGSPTARLTLEYGDSECSYPREAYRHIRRLESQSTTTVRFAFGHFPLTDIGADVQPKLERQACAELAQKIDGAD